MAVGVVRFDDDKLCTSGWASFGGEPPIRIKSPSDLATADAWIADLSYIAYRDADLFTHPYIKRPDFLRVAPRALANELGLAKGSIDGLPTLSLIYTRAARVLEEHSDISVAQAKGTIVHELKSHWPEGRYSIEDRYADELRQAILGSTQEVQGGAGRAARGNVFRTMAFPRTAYAKHLVSLPLPVSGSWRIMKVQGGPKRVGVTKGRRVRGGDAWLEKLATHSETSAIFLKVNVTEMMTSRARYGSFSKGARSLRRWATAPEILSMADFASIEVDSGFACDFGEGTLPLIPQDPTFSTGLAAEILWISAATPLAAEEGSARGAYLRMYDRMECMGAARHLAENGYPIGSSGTGRVIAYTSPQDPSLNSLAMQAGLLPTPS